MSQWQDSSSDGDGWRWEVEQACEVYLRYLARERGWLWVFLLSLVFLALPGLDAHAPDSAEDVNLAVLVAAIASIAAYLLSVVLQGGLNLAREVFHLHNLGRIGFDPQRIPSRQTPPLGWALPSWLLYWAEISYFSVRYRLFFFYCDDHKDAQRTLNNMLTSYYCACIEAGMPAMRTADLVALTVWGILTLTSLALAFIYVFVYKQHIFTDQGVSAIPFCAMLCAIGAYLPLLLRINGCLTSFIQALRTYVRKLPRAWPPPGDAISL
jgi:hypothetical protein